MNSVKTNSNKYSTIRGKAIAAIMLVPEKGQFRAYVAWETEEQAIQGRFAIIESQTLLNKENLAETVSNIADYGNDVTHKLEIRKLFGNLF